MYRERGGTTLEKLMIPISSLAVVRLYQNAIIVKRLLLNIAHIILSWVFYILFTDFKKRWVKSILRNPWRDILRYLQKCEGCTHFCDTLYMYKEDLALNNQQQLIFHKIYQPTNMCSIKLARIHLKIRLSTHYWLRNHMYNPLTLCKQMRSDSFKNVYKSYIICVKKTWY